MSALLSEAREITKFAYAPYSNFRVGAVAKLINGEKVTGTNQENASYPAGICAERTLLSTASSLFPGVAIDTIAISYNNINGHKRPANKSVWYLPSIVRRVSTADATPDPDHIKRPGRKNPGDRKCG